MIQRRLILAVLILTPIKPIALGQGESISAPAPKPLLASKDLLRRVRATEPNTTIPVLTVLPGISTGITPMAPPMLVPAELKPAAKKPGTYAFPNLDALGRAGWTPVADRDGIEWLAGYFDSPSLLLLSYEYDNKHPYPGLLAVKDLGRCPSLDAPETTHAIDRERARISNWGKSKSGLGDAIQRPKEKRGTLEWIRIDAPIPVTLSRVTTQYKNLIVACYLVVEGEHLIAYRFVWPREPEPVYDAFVKKVRATLGVAGTR